MKIRIALADVFFSLTGAQQADVHTSRRADDVGPHVQQAVLPILREQHPGGSGRGGTRGGVQLRPRGALLPLRLQGHWQL